ncbi:MAG TPA: LiaF domain-containing protein [Puia sp.]|nr:LiaF domain-containing protein [Puia sp.]
MDYRKRHETGRIWAGLFLLLAGATLLLHEQGLFVPDVLFNWHLLVAALGIFLGFARGFRGFAWLIVTAVGAVGLFEDYYTSVRIETFIWPIVIILIGLVLLFRRRRPWEEEWEAKWQEHKLRWHAGQQDWHRTKREWKRQAHREWRNAARDFRDHRRYGHAEETVYSDDKVDIAASFGTFRKKLLSKSFRGGYAMTFMGNMEIDLMEASFNGTIRLEITQIMGTTTILVPEDWEVQPDVNVVFSDFRDRRPQPAMRNPEKVLVLSGRSVFGSIEVRTRSAEGV